MIASLKFRGARAARPGAQPPTRKELQKRKAAAVPSVGRGRGAAGAREDSVVEEAARSGRTAKECQLHVSEPSMEEDHWRHVSSSP